MLTKVGQYTQFERVTIAKLLEKPQLSTNYPYTNGSAISMYFPPFFIQELATSCIMGQLRIQLLQKFQDLR